MCGMMILLDILVIPLKTGEIYETGEIYAIVRRFMGNDSLLWRRPGESGTNCVENFGRFRSE